MISPSSLEDMCCLSIAVCMVLFSAGACSMSTNTEHVAERSYHFTNGRWYTGQGFTPTDFYIVGEQLTRARPAQVDSVIDLQGQFVVPAFAEAHTHLLGDPQTVDEQVQMYLRSGVFYALNQDPINELTPALLNRVNQPTSVDVVYTQGVVAPTWSIVARLYEFLAQQGTFAPDSTLSALDTRLIFLIDDEEDLERKWDQLVAMNDRFIKIIVAFSEEQEQRKNNPAYGYELGSHSALPGLSPRLLPELIKRAHAADLRTSVHVETAADFRLAVEAGTDFIAHLPASWQIGTETGYSDDDLTPWLLSETDAQQAARQEVVVITTAFTPADHPKAALFAEVHRHNLEMLDRHGVTLALGSDQFESTITVEVAYIARLGVFDNQKILDLLSRTTPQVIFPERKIGVLDEGYEASFLVLEANPLDDLAHIDRIALRVKQGHLLTTNDRSPAGQP